MRVDTTQRSRTTLLWLLSNLALGYVASFPLLSAVVFGYYLRAKLLGTVSAPYHGAEAQAGAAFAVVGGAFITTAAILINRSLRRRLEPHGWLTAGFWLLSVAILLTPFLYVWLSEPTIPEMLGKGFLW